MAAGAVPFEIELVGQLARLKRYASGLCRDAILADDLVQETVCKALANKHLFEPGTNLSAWLTTICRNEFLSIARKSSRNVEDADGIMTSMLQSASDHAGAFEAKEALSFLVVLPAEMRRPMMLAASGLSIEEIAARENVPDGTIKSRIHRGRVRLAELIGAEPHLIAAE